MLSSRSLRYDKKRTNRHRTAAKRRTATGSLSSRTATGTANSAKSYTSSTLDSIKSVTGTVSVGYKSEAIKKLKRILQKWSLSSKKIGRKSGKRRPYDYHGTPTAATASTKSTKRRHKHRRSRHRRDNSGRIKDIAELKQGDRVDKWVILELIGEGAFGCVYKVGHHGFRYALKFDFGYCAADEKPILVEKQVLELAKRAESKHICELIDFGDFCDYHYIVMTLLGRSLRDILKERRGGKLSAGCVISVGMQCMQAIEELHRIGFIHRDIKPGNFVTGRTELIHGVRKIFLIDFGFSYQYVDSHDRIKHITNDMSFRGTLRYAPVACHRRRPPGRRDDLESWMYQQIEFTKGALPWRKLDDEREIMEAKEEAQTKDGMKKLLRMCPKSYLVLMRYITSLRRRSTPNYDFIYKILRKTLFEAHLQEYPYDWERTTTRRGGRRNTKES